MKSIIIIIVLFLFSCQTQENKDKELIESFIKEIVLKKGVSFSDTKKYIHYGKKMLEREEFQEGIIEVLYAILEDIRYPEKFNKPINYKILSYKEAEKDSEININYHTRYSIYKSYSRVYHLVADKEIWTSFIIEDDKIISFCYGIIKSENQPREPWLLNGEQDYLWD